MTDKPDFDSTSALMTNLGFTLEEACSTPQAFGSWFIRANANGKAVRVVWDGRDGALAIQQLSLSAQGGAWSDRWIAGSGFRDKPEGFEAALRSFLNG
jgi:hypothetical protein